MIWKAKTLSHIDQTPSELPALVDDFLTVRGFQDQKQKKSFLNPKLSDLKSPFLLKDMKKACDRLIEAFQKNQKICIYADFDLDGTSGCALLYRGLQSLGYQSLQCYQPQRLAEGYGFHAHAVEELKQQGVELIVTVDVGITAFAAAQTALKCGIDVILTDHHQPLDELPQVFALVNPNQKECSSGLGYLCGAGVAFYLLRALKRSLMDLHLISEAQGDLKNLLDYLCIATLTDMVPLVEDNRVLVKAGLKTLENTDKAGLRALLEALKLSDRPLTGQDVAIRFAPKLNALSRMEMGLRPLDIYLELDAQVARSLIAQVLDNNQSRVQLQSDGETEAFRLLESWPSKQFVFLVSPSFHRGVVGLIATKVAQSTGLPTFIAALGPDGQAVGSARLGEPESSVNLVQALESATDFLQRFGGHPQAAGFEFSEKNQAQVIACLEKYFQNLFALDAPGSELRALEFDLDLQPQDVSPQFLKWVDALGPFGSGFEIPLFRIRNLKVDRVFPLGNGTHFKFQLSSPQLEESLEAIWFSAPVNIPLQFARSEVQILGELQWNYYGGRKKPQILIRGMKNEKDEKSEKDHDKEISSF